MKIHWLSLLLLAACANTGGEQNITEIATLSLDEVSGMEYTVSSGLIWALQDSGNESVLYGLDEGGKTKTQINVNTDNNDWESMAADAVGNLYIGDFGNNENDRTNLAIYKIESSQLKGKEAAISSRITFKYPQQTDFPPKKTERFFDCEAFVEHDGNFYLFSKNRSSKSDGSFSVYKVPNSQGDHEALLIGTLKTCSDKTCLVTGADISDDGKTIALITDDKIYTLTGFTEDSFENVQTEVVDLGHSSQKEGICFLDNNTLLITDERTKKEGGKMYKVSLKGKI